jgi:hypothetical protein
MALTLDEANRIIEGAVAKARELNIRVSVAVCDAGGRLVAFQRMDNAIWASAYGSQGKAVASAAFGRASGELSERADQPTPRGIAAAEGGHMIMGWSRADHPQWRHRGRLRRGRRHLAAGRGLRPCGHCAAVARDRRWSSTEARCHRSSGELPMAAIAHAGKGLDWLAEEPDHYSDVDLVEQAN